MRHTKPEDSYTNLSAPKPATWTPVVNPEPLFKDAKEKLNLEEVQRENPREPGEPLLRWIERTLVAANMLTLSQCSEIAKPMPSVTVRTGDPIPNIERLGPSVLETPTTVSVSGSEEWRDAQIDEIFGPDREPGEEG